MYKLGELTLAVGLAMTSAAVPAMAQQAQQQMPMQQGQQQITDVQVVSQALRHLGLE